MAVTEQSEREIVVASQAAWKHSNFDRLSKLISADCVVHVSYVGHHGDNPTDATSCQQAIDDTRKNLASASSGGLTYIYESTPPAISVDSGIAIAHLRTTESLSKAGMNKTSVTEEVETLQMRYNRVLITAVDAKTISIAINGKKVN